LLDYADKSFEEYDHHIVLDEDSKKSMFDDAVADMQSKISLLRKKFGVVDKKLEELT
jgi:hypothetical protein